MRRDHRLALDELEPRADNIVLILGAQAGSGRRAPGSSTADEERLEHFARVVPLPSSNKKVEERSNSANCEERSPGFLGRIDYYSRGTHAHAQDRMLSLTRDILSSYRRTMHAFTENQLNLQRQGIRSEASSPLSIEERIELPAKLGEEFVSTNREEILRAPANTPDIKHVQCPVSRGLDDVPGIDFRKLKRSLTEPCVSTRVSAH